MAGSSTPSDPTQFRLFATAGSSSRVGGSGYAYGTNEGEQFFIDDRPGLLIFDPSFSGGGDEIVLSGKASDWQAHRFVSLMTLSDGDTTVIVPVGTPATMLSFADGGRPLRYERETDSMKIGDQTIGTEPVSLVGDSDILSLMFDVVPPTEPGKLFLFENGEAAIGGRHTVIGTNEAERVTSLSGNLKLDASFGRGGDIVELQKPADDFTAVRIGSTIRLFAQGIEIEIPVGTAGLELEFGDDSRTLRYDVALEQIMIGNQAIAFEPTALAMIA